MKKTWRIAPPLALATTLHAMVLTGVVQWRGSAQGDAEGHASAQATTLSVRVAPTTAPEPIAEASPPQPQPSVATDAGVTPQLAPAPAPQPAAPAAPDLSAPAPIVTPATATVSAEASMAPGDPEQDPDRYHARRELSRPPKALTPIDIVFPAGVPTPGRHKAVLAVYIDELGHVRKVRTEGEALPLAFEDAARNAFLSAQFRAGELDGRNVKSYIHVEVVFDEQPEARGLAISAIGRTTH